MNAGILISDERHFNHCHLEHRLVDHLSDYREAKGRGEKSRIKVTPETSIVKNEGSF